MIKYAYVCVHCSVSYWCLLYLVLINIYLVFVIHRHRSKKTPGHGIEYEVHFPAYFALKLNRHEEIKDFVLQSNVPGFGKFDDVLVDVELTNGRMYYNAIQLKHREKKGKKGKNLLPANFTASGDFNLTNYCEAFKELSDVNKRYNVVLYSNINFDDSRKNEVENFTMINVPYKSNFFNSTFFNENDDKNGMYRFVVKDNFQDTQSVTKNDFQQFFSKFNLLVCQKNYRNFEEGIIATFLNDYGTDKQTAVNFINLFRKWHKGEFIDKKLDKKTLNIHLLDLLISSFVITPPLTVRDDKEKLFEASIRQFDIAVIDDSKENFIQEFRTIGVRKFCALFNCSTETKPFLQLAQELKLVERFVHSLTDIEKQKIYHYVFEEPLFLEFNEKSQNVIYKTTDVIRNLNNKIKLVLVGPNVNIKKFAELKVFSTLEDLAVVNEEFFQNIKKTFDFTFQGRKVSLEELIATHPAASSLIRVKHLFSMIQENLIVGEKTEELPAAYIPRTVSITCLNMKKVLDFALKTNSILIMNCDKDIEIIKNIIIRKGFNITKVNQLDKNYNHEVAITENEVCMKDLDKIFAKTGGDILIVKVIDIDTLEFIASNIKVRDLKKLVLNKPVAENDMHSLFSHPINVICAQPGMGKSTMLKCLKNQCPVSLWTVSVDLKQHNRFFEEKPPSDRVLSYFLEISLNHDLLARDLFNIYLKNNAVCFFFDGLDELNYDSVDNILDVLKEMASIGYRIWLSSRENLERKIESKLNIFPIRVNELNDKERNAYLKKRLKMKYEEDEIITIITKISASSNIINNGQILGVPLQLFILTETLLQDKKHYKQLDEDFFLLTKMYFVYFQGRWKHFIKKVQAENAYLLENLFKLENYEVPALQSSLGNDVINLSVNTDTSSTFLEGIERYGDQLGIITKFDDAKRPVFDHETYAEYFACRWLCKNQQEIKHLQHCLFSEKYQNLKFILDTMLAENCPLHLAIIYKNIDQFQVHIHRNNVIRDKGGRTPLHIACCHGTRYPPLKSDKWWYRLDNDEVDLLKEKKYALMFTQLLQKFKPSKKDNLFQWDCLDYSVASQCLLAIELILKHEYGSTFNFFNQDDEDLSAECHVLQSKFAELYNNLNEITLAYYCAKFGFEHLLFVLIYNEMFCTETDGFGFLLHVAVRGNHKKIIEYLLRMRIDINATNYNHETPLHIAAKTANKDIINLLVNNGASVNGSAILAPALKYAADTDIFNLLVVRGANVGYINYDKKNLLHYAAEEGKEEIIQTLIDRGLEINATDVDGISPLYLSVEQGQERAVAILLNNGANVNIVTKKKRTPLHCAAIRGSLEILGKLICGGVEVNARDELGATALHLAIEFRCTDAVEFLLENGADPNIVTNSKENAMHYAARVGNIRMIQLLTQSRVYVNAENIEGETPLHLAVRKKHFQATEWLINMNSRLDVTTKKKRTLLHYSCMGGNVEVIKFILNKGAEINAVDEDGISALHLAVFRYFDSVDMTSKKESSLHYACVDNVIEIIPLLVKSGADVNAQDKDGVSPLHVAVKYRRLPAIKSLIEHDAKVNATTSKGYTPLHYAAMNGIIDIVDILLRSGADIDPVDVDGLTPLQLAVKFGYFLVSQLLIEKGAKINTDRKGQTLLHYASIRGNIQLMKLLLDKGENENAVNMEGESALHICAGQKSHESVLLLLKRNVEFDIVTKRNETALHYAARSGVLDTVSLLIEAGMDINATNEDDENALHLALERENSRDIVDLLVERGADVNAISKNGDNVLHYAAKGGNLFKLMLKKKKLINKRNIYGATPLHVAVERQRYCLVLEMLQNGADVNVKMKDGTTPLMLATNVDNEPIKTLLQQFGATN